MESCPKCGRPAPTLQAANAPGLELFSCSCVKDGEDWYRTLDNGRRVLVYGPGAARWWGAPVIPSKETDDPALIAHARALKAGPVLRDAMHFGDGNPNAQWEAGPWHPLDVPGGVKK